MRFKDENDVRRWLRSIPLRKKELMLKIDFYTELKSGLELRGRRLDRERSQVMDKIVSTTFYEKQIAALRAELDGSVSEFERFTAELESIEKTVVGMKYLRGMGWTAIAMQTAYSERQAQRILKKALKKICAYSEQEG